jgi:hypothetical protein
MFIKSSPNSHGFVNARDTEDLWRDHFDYFYREYDEFIFVSRGLPSTDTFADIKQQPITIHPDVSGRPHLLLMHERYEMPPYFLVESVLLIIFQAH